MMNDEDLFYMRQQLHADYDGHGINGVTSALRDIVVNVHAICPRCKDYYELDTMTCVGQKEVNARNSGKIVCPTCQLEEMERTL